MVARFPLWAIIFRVLCCIELRLALGDHVRRGSLAGRVNRHGDKILDGRWTVREPGRVSSGKIFFGVSAFSVMASSVI